MIEIYISLAIHGNNSNTSLSTDSGANLQRKRHLDIPRVFTQFVAPPHIATASTLSPFVSPYRLHLARSFHPKAHNYARLIFRKTVRPMVRRCARSTLRSGPKLVAVRAPSLNKSNHEVKLILPSNNVDCSLVVLASNQIFHHSA